MSPASLPAAAAPPLESDDLLSEILLRLPPQPSSLPRARAVSRLWRSLASDPGFCARFRSHHRRRNPPLLGCFLEGSLRIHFNPALEAPNRVPEGRFQPPDFAVTPCDRFNILGCRHGLLLLINGWRDELLVWDPVSGDQRRLDKPPGFHTVSGAVLRVSAARDGDAGDHFHFQVVLVGSCDGQQHAPARIIASVYSSNTGAWGNLISTPAPVHGASMVYPDKRSVMVGNSLYWLFLGNSQGIIEFDLDTWKLALTPLPGKTATCATLPTEICVIPAAQGGDGLGFLFLSGFSAQLWKRKTDCDGVASWELSRTIALDKLLSVNSDKDIERLCIIGLAEDNNMVLVQTSIGIFTLHLESLESKKIYEPNHPYPGFCPFEGVYTAEKGIDGGHDGAELLQNVKDLSTWACCRDALIEQVSRVRLWWLRCRNGLFAVGRIFPSVCGVWGL